MALLCVPPTVVGPPCDGGGGIPPEVGGHRNGSAGTPVVKICCRSDSSDVGNTPGIVAQTAGTFARKFGFALFGSGCEPSVGFTGIGVLNDVPPPPAEFGAMTARAKTS